MKLKQKVALKNLREVDTESGFNNPVEDLELQGYCRLCRIFGKTIDLYKNATKSGSSYIELSIKCLSLLNKQNKNDDKCGNLCITAHIHPAKTNACRTKIYQKLFETIITTGICLESGIFVKDIHK